MKNVQILIKSTAWK